MNRDPERWARVHVEADGRAPIDVDPSWSAFAPFALAAGAVACLTLVVAALAGFGA